MSELRFKYRIGLTIVISNLAVLLSIIVLRIIGGFDAEEFTTLLGIVAPMFSAFTTSVIMFIIEDKHNTTIDKGKTLSFAYMFLTILFNVLFALAILVAIWLQGFNIAFDNFEDFKAFILSVESIFAAYCGYLLYAIFKKTD